MRHGPASAEEVVRLELDFTSLELTLDECSKLVGLLRERSRLPGGGPAGAAADRLDVLGGEIVEHGEPNACRRRSLTQSPTQRGSGSEGRAQTPSRSTSSSCSTCCDHATLTSDLPAADPADETLLALRSPSQRTDTRVSAGRLSAEEG